MVKRLTLESAETGRYVDEFLVESMNVRDVLEVTSVYRREKTMFNEIEEVTHLQFSNLVMSE